MKIVGIFFAWPKSDTVYAEIIHENILKEFGKKAVPTETNLNVIRKLFIFYFWGKILCIYFLFSRSRLRKEGKDERYIRRKSGSCPREKVHEIMMQIFAIAQNFTCERARELLSSTLPWISLKIYLNFEFKALRK